MIVLEGTWLGKGQGRGQEGQDGMVLDKNMVYKNMVYEAKKGACED